MTKNKLAKLKKELLTTIKKHCEDSDTESLSFKINSSIDEHFRESNVKKPAKQYLTSTGEEVSNNKAVVRTKGQSQIADSIRGFG